MSEAAEPLVIVLPQGPNVKQPSANKTPCLVSSKLLAGTRDKISNVSLCRRLVALKEVECLERLDVDNFSVTQKPSQHGHSVAAFYALLMIAGRFSLSDRPVDITLA
eukprot:2506919-Pleurochrysis_carterae.AAC.1